jgi:hypothetical protein
MFFFFSYFGSMQRIITLAQFLFFSFILNAQAEITFENPIMYIDMINYGSANEFTFKYKNTGNKPLLVSHAQTSGGGLMWWRDAKKQDSIMPGEFGYIRFKYDTKRLGTIWKTGSVYSNAKNGVATITLRGFIKPVPIAHAPETSHHFGSVNAGSKLHYEFELINKGAAPLIISKISYLKGCTASFSTEKIENFEKSILTMEVETKDRTKHINEKFMVYTNADSLPIVFSLKAEVKYSPLKIDTAYFNDLLRKDYFMMKIENKSKDTLAIYSAYFVPTKSTEAEIQFQILDSSFLIPPFTKREILIKASIPDSFIYGFEKTIGLRTINTRTNENFWNNMNLQF